MPHRDRILVTGGSGFLGANLVRALLQEGHEVHLFLRGESASPRLADVMHQVVVHRGSIQNESEVRAAVSACQPEVIYHLAGYGVSPMESNRIETLSTNVMGTAYLLEALRTTNYRALVHVGSGAEYGPGDQTHRETDAVAPLTEYAISKACAAGLCLAEARRGFPIKVVRVFAAYGPWEAAHRLTSTVMQACLRGESASVSSGTQRRDFIFIDDVIRLLMMASRESVPPGSILHAASGCDVSVREMIETIREVTVGPPVQYGQQAIRPGEPTRYAADIMQTKVLTGWQPEYELSEGVRRMWEWYRATH